HHDAPGEGQIAVRRAGAPAARRVAEAYRLRPLVDSARVLQHQRLDVLPGLILQEIGQAARQMLTLAMHEKGGRAVLLPADGDGAAPSRFVDDNVWNTAQRYPDTGTDQRSLGQLGQPLFQPILLALEEAVDLAMRQSGRDGDAQRAAAGINPESQLPRAADFDESERQCPPGDLMQTFLDQGATGLCSDGRPFEQRDGHGVTIPDSFALNRGS